MEPENQALADHIKALESMTLSQAMQRLKIEKRVPAERAHCGAE